MNSPITYEHITVTEAMLLDELGPWRVQPIAERLALKGQP